MGIGLTLGVTKPDSSNNTGSWRIVVKENFDEVINKVFPLQVPASSLEERENTTFTKIDGNRIAIPGNMVLVIEENVEDDE